MSIKLKISGIYIITCLINGKYYIGKSNNIWSRKTSHFKKLRVNNHENSYLQNAFNKYGEENFTFEILEEYPDEGFILPSMENYWCNLLDAHNREVGYNIQPTNPYNQHKHSQETKDKISKKHKGKKHTQEHKDKVQIGLIGKRATEFPEKRIPILQYDLNMNFIKEWEGTRIASKALKIWESNINIVLRNKGQKSAGGYIWKYK